MPLITRVNVDEIYSGSNGMGAIETQNIAQSQLVCRLLNLPAELRNKIYHSSLVEDDVVIITENLRPPSLLSTCRQIRSEATQIYYLVNQFEMFIRNCDHHLYKAWSVTFIKPLGKDVDLSWDLLMGIEGADWNNLIQWCYDVWMGYLPYTEVSTDLRGNQRFSVVTAATNIAFQCRELKWEKVSVQLNALKVVAGHLDQVW